MEYKEKRITLKDNTSCILRSPREEDGAEMLEYFKATAEESHFMVNYPEEIERTVEEERFREKKPRE